MHEEEGEEETAKNLVYFRFWQQGKKKKRVPPGST